MSPLPSPAKLLAARLLIAKSTAKTKKGKAKKAGTATTPPVGRTRSKDKENGAPSSKEKAKRIAVAWSAKANHPLSDSLLGIIEDSAVYKVAFGFNKGDVDSVPNGGKKVVEHHRSIARKLFIDDPLSEWTEADVKQLGESVKNRISGMKTAYIKHRGNMSETGQGLLDNGQEADIMEGSEIANIWGKVKKAFPWYLRMHSLMGSSPIVSKAALAHSKTPIDLSLLDRGSQQVSDELPQSPTNWDIEDGRDELPRGSSPVHDSHRGSPNLDNEDVDGSEGDEDEEDEDDSNRPVLKTPSRTSTAPSTVPSSVSATRGTKRKSMADSIAEVSAHERANRIRIANINANAKNVRADQRESLKRRTQLEVELARLQHQRDEAAAQRAHEALMFDKQAALELARAGHGREAPIGYAMGGPLDNVHPSLRR